jgi:hypothetical protein
MKTAIYIPTKNRPDVLKKVLPYWEEYNIPIYLVTEGQYSYQMKDLGHPVVLLRRPDKGLGYARKWILKHAEHQGFKSIVMSDDDHKPAGDVHAMIQFATRRDVVGVGMWKSIYGLLLGRETALYAAAKKKKQAAFLTTGSVGYGVFAVNVKNVAKVGGFDERMVWAEDVPVCRFGMAQLGIPWYIYTGAWVKGEIKSNSGGQFSFDLQEIRDTAQKIQQKQWPDYMTYSPRPERRVGHARNYRFAWKRFYCDTIGEKYWPPENVNATERAFGWRT